MTKQKYSPTIIVEETDFRNAWAKQVRNCMRDGLIIVANSKSKSIVNTRDINSVIVLTGNSIIQIINKQLHDQFPTKGLHLDEYIKTFTYEYLHKHLMLSDEDTAKFKYLYIERLAHYNNGEIDQIGRLYDKLREDGINRQTQIITWNPKVDFPVHTPKGHDPPCLQRIWIRVLEEPTYNYDLNIKERKGIATAGKVEIHLTWRSRDLYAAWMSNIIAVIHMLIEYVLKDEYEIVKIVDFCNSLHIYESDWEQASKIKHVGVNPQYLR